MARTKQSARKRTGITTGGKAPRKQIATKSTGKTTNLHPSQASKRVKTKPGVQALRDIKRYQKSTEHLMKRLPFQRICRYLAEKYSGAHKLLGDGKRTGANMRFQGHALYRMQEAAELYLVGIFEDASLCAIHSKRKTVLLKDLILVFRLRMRFEKLDLIKMTNSFVATNNKTIQNK